MICLLLCYSLCLGSGGWRYEWWCWLVSERLGLGMRSCVAVTLYEVFCGPLLLLLGLCLPSHGMQGGMHCAAPELVGVLY